MSMRDVVASKMAEESLDSVDGALALVIADRIDGGLTGPALAAVIKQLREIMRDIGKPIEGDPLVGVLDEVAAKRAELEQRRAG